MSKKQVAGYILDKRIGRGSYATVWKGRVEGSPEEAVAVKVISRQTVTETAQLRQEVEVLRRISHDNIVRFRDLKKSAAHFYLVLEYCAGGDLSQFLREKGRVGEEVARRFLTQIAAGLCVLHKENVLHRDLKPQNILLSDGSDSPVLKIADFGFARALQPQDMAATVCGSPLYMAPEILRHEPYDARADLWSVGAILYELLLGRPPFSGANPMQLLANIEKNDRVSFEGVTVSSQGQDFLRALLMRNPKERLSSREFMGHPYVRLESRTTPSSTAPAAAAASAFAATGPLAAAAAAAASSRAGAGETIVGRAEAVMYSSDGDSLTVPCDWCVPMPEHQGTGICSPSSGVDSLSASAAASPLSCNSPEASPRGDSSFHLACEVSPKAASPELPSSELGGSSAAPASSSSGVGAGAGSSSPAVSLPEQPAWAHRGVIGPPGAERQTQPQHQQPRFRPPERRPAAAGADEEYVVVSAQQPVSAFTRGRGPTMRAATSSFCGNLSRIAHALEQLACRLQEQSPSESLALLLRALGLLEKALNVSLAEDETHDFMRKAFRRMLDAAEAVAGPVKASSQVPCGVESLHPPARPNATVFDFAVQQAREAAVALSKGHETGGWEAACHEKLTLALLLLDLLCSEADGEDLEVIASYTAPIAKLASEVDSRLRAPPKNAPSQPSSPLLQAQPAGC